MITTDRKEPLLNETNEITGQNKAYLVLSDEERAKGFLRPVRHSYVHVGKLGYKPCGGNLRILKKDDEYYPKYYAVMCTALPNCEILHNEGKCISGSYLTKEEYDQAMVGNYNEKKGCNTSTRMATAIAETYARNPKFYGATWCMHCRKHLPVEEFVWDGTNELVGS